MGEALADLLLDNYGICERGSDCYWGKDAKGHYDGCLKVGWRGQACQHWSPLGATTWEELCAAQLEAHRKSRQTR